MADPNIPQPDGLANLPGGRAVGIYFLWRGDTVVYVGQSKTVRMRIYSHIKDALKTFDGFSWIECAPTKLLSMERRFIERLVPKYNRCGIAKVTRREKPWRDEQRKAAGKLDNAGVAAFFGLTDEQFVWLRAQPEGPHRIRVPRSNIRRWARKNLEAWSAKNAGLLEQARQT